jgi:hypothetical protein
MAFAISEPQAGRVSATIATLFHLKACSKATTLFDTFKKVLFVNLNGNFSNEFKHLYHTFDAGGNVLAKLE